MKVLKWIFTIIGIDLLLLLILRIFTGEDSFETLEEHENYDSDIELSKNVI
ncbi:hypothetical protein [Staphylococcus equorum]|uniref:hypothetical protein n=1 Tax=Staphylococcus equorum TaxID=246432 RepID=UPI003D80642F